MTRLKRFSKNENSRKKIIIGIYAFLIIGIILTGASYAVYQREAEVLFINATVGKFNTNDIELAMTLDGEQVDAPPTKDNYTVTVSCDNADGSWDMNEWLAKIGNISAGKVKCEVNFATPKATLSEVKSTTSLDYKTLNPSISLSYTASGIGTTTTCKYGTEEGNYVNTVEGATNTNCEISTGLEKDTTYYYQVCAKNGGGEVCKTGSITTLKDVLSNLVEIGDYISMTPTATSYTIATSTTGYTSTQTINPSELNLWRVIRKNSDGTVDMVSDKVSSNPVYFYGRAGYLNLVGGLNIIAAQYTDGKYVQSIRHIGYSNQTQTITDTSMISKTLAPWRGSTSARTVWTGCDTSSYLCGVDESLGAGDIEYETDYNLVNTVYGNMIAYNSSGTATAYWLASRLFIYNGSSSWIFFGRYVDSGGGLASHGLYVYNSGFSGDSWSHAVRPIVTLKSTTEIESGSGTSSSPYKLA